MIAIAQYALLAAISFGAGNVAPRLVESTADLCPAAGDARITDALKPIREKFDVPAMAGAIVTSKGLELVGVVGVRKRGTAVPAELDDLWHLGSDTKAMTATIVAKLVEEGKLKWDTTMSDVFPELAPGFNEKMRDVTLLELLTHRAGLMENLGWRQLSRHGSVQEQRLATVKEAFAKPPLTKPGSTFLYANTGYVIAGAIIERISGKPWEQMIADVVFTPLEMKSVGFGGTGTPGKIDQPWGHDLTGKPANANGPAMDNPPVMAPAGCVHCAIQDWAKFAADQVRGDRGNGALLKPEGYRTLHTAPFGGTYALGWAVTQRPWGGTVLNHCGSNNFNYANVWLAPKKDFAVLVCINEGGDKGFDASDAAAAALIDIHNGMGH